MSEKALEEYGYEIDPDVKEIFTKYRKTHKNFELQRYKGYEVVWPLSAFPLTKGVTNCG